MVLEFEPRLGELRRAKNLPHTISLVEAAELIGISYTNLWRKAKSGEFPAYKIGKRWLTNIEIVEEYLESQLYVPEQQCRTTKRR